MPIFGWAAIRSVIKIMIADQNPVVPNKSSRALNMNCPISNYLRAAALVGNIVQLAKMKPKQIHGTTDATNR